MISTPYHLSQGDLVAIIPPAKFIDIIYINKAKKILESWGLNVILSDNINDSYYQFAGNDQDRYQAFQKLLDNPEVKCIFCARGGYGTTRIIDKISFNSFKKNPKWIIGYSDITVLLFHLYNMGFQGIHGPMPLNFSEQNAEESIQRLKKILLNGVLEPISFQGNPNNIEGRTSGELIGGNLSMIVNSIGTPSDFTTRNQILFIEEVDEYLYRIDRMLVQLKRAGKLQNLSGLILGHFSQIHDNEVPFGLSIEQMILDLTSEYNYPVCFGAPFGHEMPNFPIPVGQIFDLQVKINEVSLKISED